MSNNITQVALMQVRRGKLDELPYALEEGEIGLATDTLDLFIGAPNSDKIKHRITEKIFPYGNLKILTELSESLKISAYRYNGNLEIGALFPVILTGSNVLPIVSANTTFTVNGISITVAEDTNLIDICNIINEQQIPNVRCYSLNDKFVIVSTTNDLRILNVQGTFLQDVGLALAGVNEVADNAKDLIETTVQKVLDEYLTIKHYDVKGDGSIDDSYNINEALLGTYCVSDLPQYLRTIYFPSGTYLADATTITIPSEARLIGEGIGHTVIESTVDSQNVLLGLVDKNFTPFNSPNYGGAGVDPENITIENMTFRGLSTNVNEVVVLTNGQNITFRGCSFEGNQANTQKLISIISTNENNPNLHITFDNCEFKNSGYAVHIDDYGLVQHLTMTNCRFDNIKNEAIYINPQGWATTTKTFIQNVCFTNCSRLANSVIYIGEHAYKNVILDCQFEDDVASFEGATVPLIDESKNVYTDIFDPRTDTRKVYTFNYPNPEWKYVDNLSSVTGEYIIRPVYEERNGGTAEVVNYLYIKAGSTVDDTIKIYAKDNFSDMKIDGGTYGNLYIGSGGTTFPEWRNNTVYKVGDCITYYDEVYECVKEHTSASELEIIDETYWTTKIDLTNLFVVMGKNLDLGGNMITNEVADPEHGGDITFKVKSEKVLRIQQSAPEFDNFGNPISEDIPYEEKIEYLDDAIPNVAFVKKNISNRSIKKSIVYADYINSSELWNVVNLFTASSDLYSDTIYLKNITVSVEKVFKKYDFANILEWQANTIYTIGDSVKVGATYYTCIRENSDATFTPSKWDEIEQNGVNPDSIALSGTYNDSFNSYTKQFIPANVVKLYEPETLFPETDDPEVGNVYRFDFDRNINIANYSFNLSLTNLNQQQVATNFQPSGEIFVSIEFTVN